MMNSLLRRTLPTTAAGCVLLIAGSWLIAQPAEGPGSPGRGGPDDQRDHREAGPPRSVTDDAFGEEPRRDGRDADDDREGTRDRRDRMEKLGAYLDDVLEVLDDIDPEMARRLRDLPDKDPGQRMFAVQRRFPEALRLVRLRHDDPPMYALRVDDLILYRRSETLAREIRSAKHRDDDDTAEDLTETLEDTVEQHFDVQQAIRQLELERLEARIEALKDALDERDDHKRDLIAERFRQLLEGPTRRDGRERRDDDRHGAAPAFERRDGRDAFRFPEVTDAGGPASCTVDTAPDASL